MRCLANPASGPVTLGIDLGMAGKIVRTGAGPGPARAITRPCARARSAGEQAGDARPSNC